MNIVEPGRVESIERTIAGLLAMNRMLKDRVTLVEKRCEQLEQATLELAEAVRTQSPAGPGSLPSPAGDDRKIRA